MHDQTLKRIHQLGFQLPEAPNPLGAYQATVEAGSMLYISMQGPIRAGKPILTGLLGKEVSIEAGREAAQLSLLNALAQASHYLGNLDRVKQVVRLDAYVACEENFISHPQVIDSASELLVDIFSERAGHVRTVCGVRNLPGNLPVGLALVLELNNI
ncbi:RidA family protein [Acinetobacter nosocomialis]|uniref:RidA family protein n=1 Tax=Acinetobacter nosocomialis TaxID=106654 RepID=UPI0026EDF73E|nr:RidA family protein [Acinetobacter nosocomialis]MDO7218864.1 RidA family protein [Acinetobacter nosocomialis]